MATAEIRHVSMARYARASGGQGYFLIYSTSIQHTVLIFHDREYTITKIFPFVKGYTANLWGWMMKRLSLSLSLSFFSE